MSVLKPGYRHRGWRIFLDDRELWGVFYLDRRRRIIRTFDVVDGGPGSPPGWPVEGFIGPVHESWRGKSGQVFWKELRYPHRSRVRIEDMQVPFRRCQWNPARNCKIRHRKRYLHFE